MLVQTQWFFFKLCDGKHFRNHPNSMYYCFSCRVMSSLAHRSITLKTFKLRVIGPCNSNLSANAIAFL